MGADFKGLGKCIIQARLLNQCRPDPLYGCFPLPDYPLPIWLKVMPMDLKKMSDRVDARIEHFCLCSSKVWKSQFTQAEHWSVKIPIWGGRRGGELRALDVVNPPTQEGKNILEYFFGNLFKPHTMLRKKNTFKYKKKKTIEY